MQRRPLGLRSALVNPVGWLGRSVIAVVAYAGGRDAAGVWRLWARCSGPGATARKRPRRRAS